MIKWAKQLLDNILKPEDDDESTSSTITHSNEYQARFLVEKKRKFSVFFKLCFEIFAKPSKKTIFVQKHILD